MKKTLWLLFKTGALAFFIAGAVVFSMVVPYYQTRVFISLGLMAIAYGIESMLSFGSTRNCGFLSGNCSTHSVRIYGVVMWMIIFAYALWRRYVQEQKDQEMAAAASDFESTL